MPGREDLAAQFAALSGPRPGVQEPARGDELLSLAVSLGRRIFGAAACSIALLDDDEEHLVFRAASGAGAEQVTGLRLPVGRGIAGWVVSAEQAISIDDVRRDPRFARDVAESTGYVPRSILAAPLETAERVLGVIEVLDRSQVTDRDDLALLALLAQQVALGVELGRSAQPAQGEPSGELSEMFAELGRLGAAEQHAASGFLRGFLDYVRRSGGPPGLV